MSSPFNNCYGIHLGTTEAMIALLRDTKVHIFRNAAGGESTPCAVYMNKENSLVVGQFAKDRCESDPDNAFMEFKRDMGSDTAQCFARTGKRMKPEELSAEILKSLCRDVHRATGDSVRAAVITVPAHFDMQQCQATKKAAELAGIIYTLLVSEPVAAAQAYAFDTQDDKTFWLTYDFSPGTFDAALVQVRDGRIEAIRHGGDYYLGYRNIDWAIVEELFIPALQERSRLTDFKRGTAKWRGAFAKLKSEAEKAKILLSATATTSTEVHVDFLCDDEDGQAIEFNYTLKRSDFERMASPFIRRTIKCCKELLAAQHLNPVNIGRLMLLGEGTTHPLVRTMLADPKTGLGIPLEFSLDPMTVVVCGAAVFAATNRIVPDNQHAAEDVSLNAEHPSPPVSNDYADDHETVLRNPNHQTMSTQNHAKGIDLGTTNSEIAELRGTEVHVFRNAVGAEYTPSSVYMNKENNLIVGQSAKDRCESDPDNAFMEFKRDMGSDTERCFARTGKRMKPQELSAEVLKSLCGDVQRATGQTVNAAVITVPADFDLPQNKATKEAALLAGIKHTALLTEPVAAAQAYSFDSHDDKTFWLVYDFGGGTFDAAIIQVRDSLIKVAGHKGDNQLGGKNIDWAIVEEFFLPVLKDRRLTDFKRGIPKWRGAFAKLKSEAEKAKILLSAAATASTEVHIDFLCNDEGGEPIEFDYVLKRADLERLASPFIRRTINICKEELAARRLAPENIGKLILVGGPTMMPYLRQMLQDTKEGLGVPLEFSVDPMTVVARGAAVFAASQRIAPDDEVVVNVPIGQFAVQLDYSPVGPDPDPEVAGTVSAGEGVEKDFSGYTIEFINPGIRPPWRSGKVGLGPKGNFLTNVSAEKGRENKFEIELCDPSGALQIVTPNSFAIVVKGAGVIADPTHSHNLGVALANNEVLVVYQKETPLPFRKRVDLRTAVSLKKGQSGQFIRVTLVEGEKQRANRNRIVGTLKIPAEKITRDVEAGTEIEVTIEMDKSTQIITSALIPILGDDEFEDVMQLTSASPDAKDLVVELQKVKERLKDLRQKAETTGDAKALAALQRIDGECMVSEIEKLVGPAASEPDAARQCQNVLNRLNSSLDDVEEALEWPALVEQAEKKLTYARELVKTDKYANAEDRRIFEIVERETREAIEHHVPDLLRRRLDSLSALVGDIVRRDPGIWVHWFTEAKEERDKMQDAAQAERLFAKGDRAINSGDVAGLKDAVRSLWRLLPEEARPQSISDVIV